MQAEVKGLRQFPQARVRLFSLRSIYCPLCWLLRFSFCGACQTTSLTSWYNSLRNRLSSRHCKPNSCRPLCFSGTSAWHSQRRFLCADLVIKLASLRGFVCSERECYFSGQLPSWGITDRFCWRSLWSDADRQHSRLPQIHSSPNSVQPRPLSSA